MPISLEHSHLFQPIKIVGDILSRNLFWFPVNLARILVGADFGLL